MARKFEMKDHVIRRQERTLVECTCDLCGAGGGPWDDFFYHGTPGQRLESVVSLKDGSSNQGGGYYDQYSYDVCPDCFKSKIMPIFPNPPRKEFIDW